MEVFLLASYRKMRNPFFEPQSVRVSLRNVAQVQGFSVMESSLANLSKQGLVLLQSRNPPLSALGKRDWTPVVAAVQREEPCHEYASRITFRFTVDEPIRTNDDLASYDYFRPLVNPKFDLKFYDRRDKTNLVAHLQSRDEFQIPTFNDESIGFLKVLLKGKTCLDLEWKDKMCYLTASNHVLADGDSNPNQHTPETYSLYCTSVIDKYTDSFVSAEEIRTFIELNRSLFQKYTDLDHSLDAELRRMMSNLRRSSRDTLQPTEISDLARIIQNKKRIYCRAFNPQIVGRRLLDLKPYLNYDLQRFADQPGALSLLEKLVTSFSREQMSSLLQPFAHLEYRHLSLEKFCLVRLLSSIWASIEPGKQPIQDENLGLPDQGQAEVFGPHQCVKFRLGSNLGKKDIQIGDHLLKLAHDGVYGRKLERIGFNTHLLPMKKLAELEFSPSR